jgi:hypothetical protein
METTLETLASHFRAAVLQRSCLIYLNPCYLEAASPGYVLFMPDPYDLPGVTSFGSHHPEQVVCRDSRDPFNLRSIADSCKHGTNAVRLRERTLMVMAMMVMMVMMVTMVMVLLLLLIMMNKMNEMNII